MLLLAPMSLMAQQNIDVDTLMQRAINRSAANNPQEALQHFAYDTYEKTIITDSLQNKDDSPHSFFSEMVSENKFIKQVGFFERVEGIRMAGFDEPRYEIMATTIESRSFYDEDFVIFNYRYAGPFSNRGLKHYNYTFLGDTIINNRPSYKVALAPKRPEAVPGLVGTLWLDQESLALQRAIINLNDDIIVRMVQENSYLPEQDIYMPKTNILYLEKGKTDKRLSFFKGKIAVGTVEKNPVNSAIEGKYLISTKINTNFSFSPSITIERGGLAIQVEEDADTQPDSFWDEYRPEQLTQNDLNSFGFLKEIVSSQNIENRLKVIDNFGIGYYSVNFFDFDLTYPIKFNNYEGLRLGMGGVTNSQFSDRFRLEGYVAYGFKDKAFKYGVGGGILLNEYHGAWLSLTYNDDIQEVGSYNYLTDRRVYSLFEPRLVNISQYYAHKTIRVNQEYRLTPKVLSELQLANINIEQIIPYTFLNDGKRYTDYILSEATFGVRWTPFSKYMHTKAGTTEIYDGYPVATAQITQGIKNVFNSDFSYTKIGANLFYQIVRLNKSTTQFLVEGKLAFGDIPLTQLYHAFPDAPNKPTILGRFSVAGIHSFETMYFGEFYSDRLATMEIKHRLKPFDFGKKFKPELVFLTRYAIGDVSNPQNHLNVQFKSLKHGYSESGFELNKIIFGFGTSLTYRYGAYSLPNFEDNVAFKFTFNLSL
ncbi:DUF5686 family protein [Flavimarina sp. Hel_I_48]|uniref:DUF5686 family protein n=1 Tax=Flavimarina sp. Hel_I_48 TaxID=1392488 RepID=UPI000A9D2702|nr:DUF5686 family protein [Flavimarina sp. Hel_I_48]